MSEALTLSQTLMSRASITPDDAGCQALLADKLKTAGFDIESHHIEEVDNLWATHGQGVPCFVYVGHTDVVPSGDIKAWDSDPFTPSLRDGKLYGRGAADMKTSLTAMTLALCDFVKHNPNHPGTIAVLITSDEEGKAQHGVKAMVEKFKQQQRRFDYCLVGEPSSNQQLADTIRIGRRGSLNAQLVLKGKQGHVAYPELAKNPIHHALNFLSELTQLQWDEKSHPDFPATSMQIVNLNAGLGVNNVIPPDMTLSINWRFSAASSQESITQQLLTLLEKHQCDYDISWRLSGKPFITDRNAKLVKTVQTACQQQLNISPELSTGGGTSDGRFVAEICEQIIELGVINASIHKVNEHVIIEDIDKLQRLYYSIIHLLYTQTDI